METVDKKLSPKVSTENIQNSTQGVPLKFEKVLQVRFGVPFWLREGSGPLKSKIERWWPLEKTICNRMRHFSSFDSALARRHPAPKFSGVENGRKSNKSKNLTRDLGIFSVQPIAFPTIRNGKTIEG